MVSSFKNSIQTASQNNIYSILTLSFFVIYIEPLQGSYKNFFTFYLQASPGATNILPLRGNSIIKKITNHTTKAISAQPPLIEVVVYQYKYLLCFRSILFQKPIYKISISQNKLKQSVSS
jgi:hypothetical protein